MVKNCFQFLGQILLLKFSLQVSTRQMALPSGNLHQLRHYGPRAVAIRVGAVRFRKIKEKVNTSGNCIFHVYGEQTSLNRLLSFLAHHVTPPMISMEHKPSVNGLRCGGGRNMACSLRKAESSITLHVVSGISGICVCTCRNTTY
jgi:hypothetical protein